jgi:hypothetical protein
MAFCTNCGASLPDGTAFCTSCGAKLAPAPPPNPAAPAYAAPAYAAPAGYPAPAPKKKHTGLIIGIIAAVLVIAAVVVLFLTGVLGSKGPTGTWTLVSSSDDDYEPGDLEATLYKDGKGYVKHTYATSRGDTTSSAYAYFMSTYYLPVTWTDTVLLIDGEAATFTRDGDTMTVLYKGATLIFNRTGGVEKRSALKPGQYVLTSAFINWTDRTEELKATVLTVNDGGTGMTQNGSYTNTFTWDEYFFTFSEGDKYFYTFDGTTLKEYYGSIQLTFTRVG